MQTIAHAIPTTKMPTPQRVAGVAFVAALHILVISALIIGLRVKLIPIPTTETTVTFPHQTAKPPQTPPTTPQVEGPQQVYVPVPTWTNEAPPEGPTITVTTTTPPASSTDHGVRSVMETHTTPPYPALEQRAGIEGTVYLRLTVSPQGLVTDAVIMRSSGSPGLDNAARVWVISHWRYQPAVRGGAPVAAMTDVAVRFNLRTGNAG